MSNDANNFASPGQVPPGRLAELLNGGGAGNGQEGLQPTQTAEDCYKVVLAHLKPSPFDSPIRRFVIKSKAEGDEVGKVSFTIDPAMVVAQVTQHELSSQLPGEYTLTYMRGTNNYYRNIGDFDPSKKDKYDLSPEGLDKFLEEHRILPLPPRLPKVVGLLTKFSGAARRHRKQLGQ